MSNFVIIPDASSDLGRELRERFEIPDYLRGVIYFPDGRAEKADLDWELIDPKTFYESMKDRKVLYTTASTPVGDTLEVFEKQLKLGNDILSISLSSALSGTYQSCQLAANQLLAKYPERKIICVDSMRYSTALALLVIMAVQKKREGATLEETAEFVDKNKHCIHQMGPMDDLFFLTKTGRISNFKAFFGSLMGVNPMADFNRSGLSEVIGKFKGKKAAFDATLEYIKGTIADAEKQIIFVAHSNREQAAELLAERIRDEIAPKEVIINNIGMSCGASIGPGLCAAFYCGAEITEGMEREKTLMDAIINNQKTKKTVAASVQTEDEKDGREDGKTFALLTDSTCDLPKELREQYDIEYAPMNYVVDESEYIASLDWEAHSPKDFYDLMRNGKRVFTTQVPKMVYYEKFKELLDAGKDILYISCSSGLSGSINTAKAVARDLKREYPNAHICCVDSLISSLGQGYLVMMAAEKRMQGMSASNTAKYIESIKLCVNQCGSTASLEYLRRAGRVKASKAFFGNLFGVKPLIISDIKGQNYAYKKVKGTHNARIGIAQDILAAADGNYDQLFISHADCIEEAELLKEEILKVAPFKKVTMSVIGPIVGASVGPGTVIAFCLGKEVTVEGDE